MEGRNIAEGKVPPGRAFDVENAQSISLKYAKFVKIILKTKKCLNDRRQKCKKQN